MLQLALSAHALVYENLSPFVVIGVNKVRNDMVQWLLNKISEDNRDFYLNEDTLGTSILHAASMFFIGDLEVLPLCPKRRVNPIKYGNLQIQV